MKKTFKKAVTLILAFAFIVSAFAVMPLCAKADDTRIVFDGYSKAACEGMLGSSAPTHSGYLFAGWFNEDETTVIADAEGIAGDTVKAKFVRADLSRIACQLNATNELEPSTRNMRMISVVDSTDYEQVGFNIYCRRADGKEWLMRSAQTTTVYSGIKVYASPEDENPSVQSPADVFGEETTGYKFTTIQISGIPSNRFDARIIAKPFWITKDGVTVEGCGEFNRIDDEADEIVNVSVNIKEATAIAAGVLNIGYSSSDFEYVDADYGCVFKNMKFHDTGSAVNCIGYVVDASGNSATPNDVFVNLRFRRKDGYSLDAGVATFTPGSASFKNISESDSTVYTPVVKY